MGLGSESPGNGAVLVTGAGRGIGRAVALSLAAHGYDLVLLSRSHEALAETHRLCEAKVQTVSQTADVRNEADILRIHELLGDVRLCAVVNNAGVGAWSELEETPTEAWDEQLETNLRGAFLVARETVRYFRRQGYGLYVNVGSDCSLIGMATRAAYSASKHGMVGLTLALRAELGADGIHVCMVYAGKTDTHFRGHAPGDRPGALRPEQVASAITFAIDQYPSAVIADISVLPPADGMNGARSLP